MNQTSSVIKNHPIDFYKTPLVHGNGDFEVTMPKDTANNIYSLSNTGEDRRKRLLASLPKPVRYIHGHGEEVLLTLFDNYFAEIDTTLFELAKNCKNQADQDRYFAAMRDMRSNLAKIRQCIKTQIKDNYVALAENSGEAQNEYQNIKADNLSVVDNQEMDAIIAKESMVKRAIAKHKAQLNELILRLDAVVPANVDVDSLPIGPNALCNAYLSSIQDIETEGKALLVLLKLFEQHVLEKADKLYVLCNTCLQDRGILPLIPQESPSHIAQQTYQSEPGQPSASLNNSSANPTHARTHARTHEGYSASQPANYLGNMGQTNPGMHTPSSFHAGSHFSAETNANSGLMDGFNLFEQLKTLVNHQHQNGNDQGFNLAELSKDFINSDFETSATERKQLNSIKLTQNVFHQFDHIFPKQSSIAPLVRQLELPVAQLTCEDPSFLRSPNHSAKLLLNQILDAFVKVDAGGRNQAHTDPLFKKCEAIVQQIASANQLTTPFFEQLLKDFSQFQKEDDHRTKLLERRTVSTEEGRLRSEQIEQLVNSTLDEVCDGLKIADAVSQLIEYGWRQVLFYTGLKYGPSSEQWELQLQRLIDLIAYTQAFSSQKEQQQAVENFPQLIDELRRELREINLDRFKSDKLIADLKQCFKDLLVENKQSVVAKQTQKLPQKKVDEIMQAVDKIVSERESTATNLEIAEAFLEQAKNLGRGTWFELSLDGEKVRARLAAIIGQQDLYIFVNRTGLKLKEFKLPELALALQNQNAKPLDSNQMFDIALSAVIQSTKSKKQGNLASN